MYETVKKIEALIASLESNEGVDTLGIYREEGSGDYLYYYDISGYLEDSYFNIWLMQFSRTGNVKHIIVFTTDCKEAIREIVESHGISLTE